LIPCVERNIVMISMKDNYNQDIHSLKNKKKNSSKLNLILK